VERFSLTGTGVKDVVSFPQVLKQLARRYEICIVVERRELDPGNTDSEGIDIDPGYICTKTGGLNQRGSTSHEWITDGKAGERVVRVSKVAPELRQTSVSGKRSSKEKSPNHRWRASRPPLVDRVGVVVAVAVPPSKAGHFSEGKARFQHRVRCRWNGLG